MERKSTFSDYSKKLESGDAAMPRGGGFGRGARIADTRPRAADMVDTPPIRSAGDKILGAVEQSVRDRGGFPTRGGVPKMTRMQERAASREAARQPPDYEKRAARSGRFGIKGFARGGSVSVGPPSVGPGTTSGARDYGK